MIYPRKLLDIIHEIRKQNPTCRIYMYTATLTKHTLDILNKIDGLTLTLHEQKDVDPFFKLQPYIHVDKNFKNKSLRLNIFNNIKQGHRITSINNWKIKNNIEWIENCPLPEHEVFMRYEKYSGLA